MLESLLTLSGEIKDNCSFEGLTVGTTSYHSEAINNAPHSHENPIVCFMLRGGGVERTNQFCYERYARDARFYRGQEPHQSTIKVFPSKCLNLELNYELLDQYEISEHVIERAVGKNPNIKFSMLKIHQELTANDSFTDSSIRILLLGLFDEAKKKLKKPEWIKKLDELLNDRWAEHMSLEDLALAVNVHPVTISKYFTKHFSCTLGEYMRKLKIERSFYLIKDSNLPLTDIALQCGFADHSHFTRNFKKLTGFLPKDFRRF